MKLWPAMAEVCLMLMILPTSLHAQQQAKASSDQSITHLHLDVLLTEYDGDKKISSLTYTMILAAREHNAEQEKLAVGLKVPIATSSGTSQQFEYQDVGTDILAHATTMSDGSYELGFRVASSSVYSADQDKQTDSIPKAGGLPIVRSFSSSFDVGLRDGQTAEGTSATDPFNGHVVKISVTLHVLK